MKRVLVGIGAIVTAACTLWLFIPMAVSQSQDPATAAMCATARAEVASNRSVLITFDPAKKEMMREAFAKQCWSIPADEAQAHCERASAAWARVGRNETVPAGQREAGLASCRKAVEGCYREMIAMTAGQQSSATVVNDCLQSAVFEGESAARRQFESAQRANPDNDVVRLSPTEVATVEAAFTRAFGGTSPMTKDLMRASDPMFLTFQNGRLISDNHLAAMRQLSHARSHYFVKQRTESVIKQVDAGGRSDNRGWNVTFFIGPSGKTRLMLPVARLEKPYAMISAYVVRKSGGQEVAMEAVPAAQGLYVMDDPGEFEQILFHGEAKLSAENQLYLLRATPALDGRIKFFDAIRSAMPKN
jgi:hypothetical protein